MFETKNQMQAEIASCLIKEERQVRLEGDGVLPDYTDDIHRIITCDAKVTFSKKRLYTCERGVVLELCGIVTVRAVYRGEDAGEILGLNSHAFTTEFSEEFLLKNRTEVPDPYHLLCHADVTSAVCRATGKKKCTYSVSFLLSAEVWGNETLLYFSSEDENIETLEKTVSATRLVSAREETFEVEEEIELGEKLPPILNAVDTSMTLICEWVKETEHGADLGLLGHFYFAYQSEETEEQEASLFSFVNPVEITEHLLFSESFDTDALQVCILPGTLKAEVLPNSYGERSRVKFHFTYAVTSAVYETVSLSTVTDAYCISGNCEMDYERARGITLGKAERITLTEDFELPLSEPIRAAENCTATLLVRDIIPSEKSTELFCKITFSALGVREEDGRIIRINETVEPTLSVKLPTTLSDAPLLCREAVCTVKMEPHSAGIRARMSATLTFLKKTEELFDYVSDFKVLPTQEVPFSGVRFYYPSEDETLWDIAREYRVRRAALMAENEMTSESPLPKMLMIAK